MKRYCRWLWLFLGLAGMAPGAASAAFIMIDDTAADDTITFTWGGFDVGDGFGADGVPSSTPSGSVTTPETGPVTFAGAWLTPGVGGIVSRTIYLVEGIGSTEISDALFFIIVSDGTNSLIQGQFQSDTEASLGTVPPATDPGDIFVEDGQPVVLSYPFLTITVLSDVEPVPAPASLGLIGVGLGAIGWMRRRKTGAAFRS